MKEIDKHKPDSKRSNAMRRQWAKPELIDLNFTQTATSKEFFGDVEGQSNFGPFTIIKEDPREAGPS